MNRKIAPEIKDAVGYNPVLKPCKLTYLDNGVPVYIIDAGSQEVVNIEIVFAAGAVFQEKKRVAVTTSHLLKNGTKTRTALQISEIFDYYGAHCRGTCMNETAQFNITSLSKHLDKLLPVVNDLLQNAIFPQDELDIELKNGKQELEVNLKRGDFVANRLIDSYVFGPNHPYGQYSNLEDYGNVSREDIVKFYNRYYLNGKVAIFVSGKLPVDFISMVNANLGSLKVQAMDFSFPKTPVSPLEEKKYRIINDKKSVQGAIRIASPFPGIHHPDYRDAKILSVLFGGFFGSRLMQNIREDKGYTYGIGCNIKNFLQHSVWEISTEAGKDVCEATIKEVYLEMEKLRNESVDERELLLVKNYMMGNMLSRIDGPHNKMAWWQMIITSQYPENYFESYIAAIKNVSAHRMQELANKYLQPDQFYELVVY